MRNTKKLLHKLTRRLLPSALLLLAAFTLPASAKISVATSLTDFASIANAVGGERVEAFAIAKPTANPHSVEVLPSYMTKVARAQLYVKVGLGLDGWAEAIIHGSRNTRLVQVDASRGVSVLEIPTGKVDASLGDVHPEGNPHYWLNPNNALPIAQNIHDALVRIDPTGAPYYDQRLEAFRQEAARRIANLRTRMQPLARQTIFTYHSSWPYFAQAFELRIVGKLEPVPGIPPTARHLNDLLEIARNEHPMALLLEPYFSREGGEFLQRSAGIPTRTVSPSCTGVAPDSYWNHFDEIVATLTSR
jgi:ABC-type Zn uptake system ZnuABC Zn-binding protein ZnuA